MKIGIVGSRRRISFFDRRLILDLVRDMKSMHGEGLTIISGGCHKGADNFAEQAAEIYGVPMVIHRPEGNPKNNWEFRFAAYARNKKIAQDSDVLYALVSSERRGGTENTIRYMKNMGKDVWVECGGGTFYLEHEAQRPDGGGTAPSTLPLP